MSLAFALRSLPASRRARLLALTALAATAATAGPAHAYRKASHAGWPQINGALIMNREDQSRPIDARPGHDPFDGTDTSYSCDGHHISQECFVTGGACAQSQLHTYLCAQAPVMPPGDTRHNELLGGSGNDVIHGGDGGDVIWGDYEPVDNSTTQVDHLYGGSGNDFIYASHGTNYIHTGGGVDVVHAHFGHGEIWCDSPTVLVYLSHRSSLGYTLHGCTDITYRLAGTVPA